MCRGLQSVIVSFVNLVTYLHKVFMIESTARELTRHKQHKVGRQALSHRYTDKQNTGQTAHRRVRRNENKNKNKKTEDDIESLWYSC